MTDCNKRHYNKKGNVILTLVQVPCYFIAGVCIVDPIHEGGLTSFLKSTYPYHHSHDYEKSKRAGETIVPNDIVAAHINA